MKKTRPVRVANMLPRLPRSVIKIPGKLFCTSQAVLPVVAGWLVARPKAMPGMDSDPMDCCQVATDCQLPPKLNWCAPLTQDRVSDRSFTGALRREGAALVVIPERP